MDKEGYFIMIKRSINQEGITTLNFYVPNNRPLKYVQQKLIELKRKVNKSATIRDFNIPFVIIDRTSSQKISKDM